MCALLPVGLSNPGCAGAEGLICPPEPSNRDTYGNKQNHTLQIESILDKTAAKQAQQPICQSYWRSTAPNQLKNFKEY